MTNNNYQGQGENMESDRKKSPTRYFAPDESKYNEISGSAILQLLINEALKRFSNPTSVLGKPHTKVANNQ